MRLPDRLLDRGRGEIRDRRGLRAQAPAILRRKPGKRHRQGSSAGIFAFTRGVNLGVLSGYEPSPNSDVRAIEAKAQALSPDRLLERYHELVDKRLEGAIEYTELFELDRIEVRLDAEGEAEAIALAALNGDWRRERSELLTSIERLLARVKAAD